MDCIFFSQTSTPPLVCYDELSISQRAVSNTQFLHCMHAFSQSLFDNSKSNGSGGVGTAISESTRMITHVQSKNRPSASCRFIHRASYHPLSSSAFWKIMHSFVLGMFPTTHTALRRNIMRAYVYICVYIYIHVAGPTIRPAASYSLEAPWRLAKFGGSVWKDI